MHTVKGGWVWQTFALAKSNESDSGGRKSRIRRSKEERKAMAESFIKKYQNKNNGNFPSLNLAHKEVGGSFYTVREIVREIIQENRVLGPAKFSPQEKIFDDQVSQEYPLGSIATEPETPLSLSPNETQPDLISSLNYGDSDELMKLIEEKHSADKELQVINESQIELKNDESVVTAEAEVVLDKSDASTSKLIDLTNVEVESFPLESMTKGADSTSETTGEITGSAETSDEKQNADLNLGSAHDNSRLLGLNSQEKSAREDDKAKKNHARSRVAVVEIIDIGDSKVAGKLAESSLESSDISTTKEGIINDTENSKSLIDKGSPHDASTSEGPEDIKEDASVQAVSAPKGVPAKSLNGALRKSEAEESFQESKIKPEPDGPSNGSNPKGSNPTLDRINLESWEVSSRSASRNETNPLLAIFKAFVASFVKFWSE